ncbi:hypothetical protein GCM10010517_27930 [Streptosporangium fragile]|uniref:Uncharacterized protein n=1 Tax=Streptosporangium fragile TaxID=46186 RepID=A0ABN3VWJ4_9ACTN
MREAPHPDPAGVPGQVPSNSSNNVTSTQAAAKAACTRTLTRIIPVPSQRWHGPRVPPRSWQVLEASCVEIGDGVRRTKAPRRASGPRPSERQDAGAEPSHPPGRLKRGPTLPGVIAAAERARPRRTQAALKRRS